MPVLTTTAMTFRMTAAFNFMLASSPLSKSVQHWIETVAEFLSPPDGLILFCGMSIGFEDVTVSYVPTPRAPFDETVTFVEGEVAGKGRRRVNGSGVSDHIADSHE